MRLTYTQIALMQACARGPRQLSLINELIGNGLSVYQEYRHIPGYSMGMTSYLGESELPFTSWKALKNRLLTAGFTVRSDKQWGENGFITIGLGAHK